MPEHDVTERIFERLGEISAGQERIDERLDEQGRDIRAIRETQQSHGTAFAGLEARFNEHRRHCDERFAGQGRRIEQLGAAVDGQEISQVHAVAVREERVRIAGWIKWLVGAALAIASAVGGYLAR